MSDKQTKETSKGINLVNPSVSVINATTPATYMVSQEYFEGQERRIAELSASLKSLTRDNEKWITDYQDAYRTNTQKETIISKLHLKLNEKQHELDQLQEQLRIAKDAFEESMKIGEMRLTQINEHKCQSDDTMLQAEVDRLKTICHKLRNEYDWKLDEMHIINENLRKAKADLEDTQRVSRERGNAMDKYRDTMNEYVAEISQLKVQRDAARENADSTVNKLNEQAVSKENEIDKLHLRIIEKQETIDDAQRHMSSAATQISNLRIDHMKMCEQVTLKQKEVDVLNEQLHKTKEELAESERISELRLAQINGHQCRLSGIHQSEIDMLNTNYNKACEQIVSKQNQIDRLEADNRKFAHADSHQKEDIETLSVQLRKTNSDLDAANYLLFGYQGSLKCRDNRICDLKVALEQEQVKYAELQKENDRLGPEVNHLTERLSQVQYQLANAQSTEFKLRNELDCQASELTAANVTIAELRAELEKQAMASGNLYDLKAKIEQQTVSYNKLNEELLEQQRIADRFTMHYHDKKEALNEALDEIQRHKETIDARSNAVIGIRKENDRLWDECRRVQNESAKKTADLEAALKVNAQLRKDLADAKKCHVDKHTAATEVHDLTDTLQKTQAANKVLMSALQSLQDIIAMPVGKPANKEVNVVVEEVIPDLIPPPMLDE
jgi:chromosome segregation ATPase